MFFKKLTALIAAALCLSGHATAQEKSAVKAASPFPTWLESAVIYEANLRQGTPSRDLKGLRKELPRLRQLGIDVIWLMPIHPISLEQRKGSLGSYYAVQDYKKVNPEFGTFVDLKALVNAAHSLGMRVILDEVCNHTGADNPWVEQHPEYYARNDEGKMYGPYDWTDVFVLDYRNPDTRAAMTDALLFWVKEADVDGYRCDVAGEVLTDFWEEVRPKLQAVKSVMMLAEASKPELLAKAFDVDYAWPMKDLFNAIAATKGINKWAIDHKENRPAKSAIDIPALIEKQAKEFPVGSIHMNMITNHDLNSWEGTEFDRYGEAVRTFAVLSFTLPGVPMMYTGQEVGFNHAFEFFEQDKVIPDYTQNDLTLFYQTLTTLKHGNKALKAHVPANFVKTPCDDILLMCRESEGDRVVVVANLSSQTVSLSGDNLPAVSGLKDLFTGAPAALPASLTPWQYQVFVSK
ncbi:MAG: alpha-amylase family glycosyl hydrolase [Lepagella sp.]